MIRGLVELDANVLDLSHVWWRQMMEFCPDRGVNWVISYSDVNPSRSPWGAKTLLGPTKVPINAPDDEGIIGLLLEEQQTTQQVGTKGRDWVMINW